MEYQFSSLISESAYETEGLCDGIPVRRHNYPDLETTGTIQAQRDWARLVAPLGNHNGGLGPRYNFMAISMPECIPARFSIVSYANEFAFLYDDVVDSSSEERVSSENADLMKMFENGVGGHTNIQGSGKRQLLAKVLSEMMVLDRERALIAMKGWATFVESSSGREHHKGFENMKDYLPYRCKDIGHMFWHALVTFGCGLSISEAEQEVVSTLVMPAVTAASLTNDLFSFKKEYFDSMAAGRSHVVNGIWVLMKEHQISLDEAKERCRDLIKREVKTFVQTVHEVKMRTDLSRDARIYVEMMQYSVSGNLIWSRECPRYHQGAEKEPPQYLKATLHGFMKIKQPTSPAEPSLPPTLDRSSLSYDHCEHQHAAKRQKTSSKSWNTVEAVPSPDISIIQDGSCNLVSLGVMDDSLLTKEIPGLSANIVLGPYHYLASLPSKGIRSKAIDALNFWLEAPSSAADIVSSVVNMLHSSSLMLDDLEDRSQLRRGRPSTHIVYGMAQTINSATFLHVEAIEKLGELKSPRALSIFTEEIRRLFIGQSYDIYWTREMICPSVTEYLQMIDGMETGGLFRLLTRLLLTVSPRRDEANLDRLACLLGRYFQIRDDYQNIVSVDYAAHKGFCEDLDEGKYSLPLIHTFHNTTRGIQLRGLLQRRRFGGELTREQKELVLEEMKSTGSLGYTLGILQKLQVEIELEVRNLEHAFGAENFEMRALLSLLKCE